MLGRLRERVTIQAESRTADGYGGSALAWTDQFTCWARVTPKRGQEGEEYQQVEDRQMYEVRIRYRSSVTPAMRVKWGSKLLNIRAVANTDERERFLVLECEEGVAT